MNLSRLASPIGHKVTSCEEVQETWMQDHKLALEVFKLEDLMKDVVECYDDLQRFDGYVLKQLQEKPHAYDEELDIAIIDLCRRVHHMLESINTDLLPGFECDYGDIENADVFRNRLERARESAEHGYRKDAKEINKQMSSQLWDALENTDAA